MAPCGIADTPARVWLSFPMQFPRVTRPTSRMEDTASSSVTARSTMAAKTLSKPITPHTFGVASTWLLACNVLSTLDTIVTAVPCLYPLSGFIWSSSKLLKNRVNLNPSLPQDEIHNSDFPLFSAYRNLCTKTRCAQRRKVLGANLLVEIVGYRSKIIRWTLR